MYENNNFYNLPFTNITTKLKNLAEGAKVSKVRLAEVKAALC